MRKNTGTRTATTFTIDPALDQLDAEEMAELSKPYVWESLEAALRSVEIMRGYGDTYRVVEHEAPGLSVFAIYRRAHRNAEALILMSVIVIEDDTAARLHTAVRKAQPVTVTYTKADGEETVRTIEPTALKLTKAGDVIVSAADRKPGDKRSFRLDRIRFYTLHRTAFTVRTEAPAPTKADLVEDFRSQGARVEVEGRGWTGHLVPGSRAYSASGWTAKLALDPEYLHLASSGTIRVSPAELNYI